MSAQTDAKIRRVMDETLAVIARGEPENNVFAIAIASTANQVTLAGILIALRCLLDETQELRRLVAELANARGSDPASSGGSIPPGATKENERDWWPDY